MHHDACGRVRGIALDYSNIASAYSSLAEYDKALTCLEKALEIYLQLEGELGEDTARCYNNMGIIYSSLGDYNRAIEYYAKALEIRQQVLGEEHPETATCYNNLGSVYFDKGEYEKAIGYFEKSRAESGSGRAEFMARNIDCYLYLLKASSLLKDVRGFFATSESMRARGFLDRLTLSAALSVEGVSEADRPDTG